MVVAFSPFFGYNRQKVETQKIKLKKKKQLSNLNKHSPRGIESNGN